MQWNESKVTLRTVDRLHIRIFYNKIYFSYLL